MPILDNLVRTLRRAEKRLGRQLSGIRTAIASLELSDAEVGEGRRKRKNKGQTERLAKPSRRRMSATARKAISEAQKARWARQKASSKKGITKN